MLLISITIPGKEKMLKFFQNAVITILAEYYSAFKMETSPVSLWFFYKLTIFIKGITMAKILAKIL